MIELLISKNENGTLSTNKGLFHLGEECVTDDETGEVFTVAGSTTDESGDLCQLMIE